MVKIKLPDDVDWGADPHTRSHTNDPQVSKEAAAKVPYTLRQQQAVWLMGCNASYYPKGEMTPTELAELGERHGIKKYASLRSRTRELERKGLMERVGRREGSETWRLTDKGLRVFNQMWTMPQ